MKKAESIKIVWKWRFEMEDIHTWKKRIHEEYNLIPTVGKQAIAIQLAWDNTTNMWDNLFIALWDSAVAPAVSDTILGNETTRKAAWSTNASSWVTNIAVFFAAWEATWTHKEFWLFGDWNTTIASWSVDTGILYSHVSTTVSISASETLTATFTISFT